MINQFYTQTFSLIDIDGNYTYGGVKFDIERCASLVKLNGLLLNNVSYYTTGRVFWKGYEPVSHAYELILSMMGFMNVLNVGHNRVYWRVR